jgi:hypothetical protein
MTCLSKKICLWIAFASSAFTTTSCLTVGEPFSSSVSWIKPHKTTKAEVERVFGQPFRTGYDSGLMTYSYGYYKYSAFEDSQTKDLTIRFDNQGIVESYTFSSSFPDDKKVIQSGH